MDEQKSYCNYIKELLNLAMPMIMGNLSIILICAADVFVAARYSTQALASISIANSIVSTIFMFGVGLLVSISPLLSNFRGEKNNVKKYFLPTIQYAMILSLFSALGIIFCIPFIDKIGFEASLVPDIKKYMLICSFSTFGTYLHTALKEYLQAYEIVFFPNFLNAIGVVLHLILNFVLVFGWFGLPALGAVGLAISTLFARTMIGLVMFLYCLKLLKIKKYRDFQYFLNLLRLGFPIAAAILLEFGAFNIITVLAGRISGLYAGAQNILLTVTTATFMVPLAISNAIAVKVGFANGANNFLDVKKYSFSGILLSVSFMSFCAICFLLFPRPFITVFTSDVELIKICVPILLLAGLFQVFDGLQISLGGVFKGLKKTNVIMAGDFVAYWLVGIPLGLILALKYNLNLFGFWIGLTVSIFLLGVSLFFIMIKLIDRLIKSAK